MIAFPDAPLDTTEIVVVDIQATGARPEESHVLELGWSRCRAADTSPRGTVTVKRVMVPAEAEVPSRVLRVTGFRAEELAEGMSPEDAYASLIDAVRRDSEGFHPLVAHYARYETAFLTYFHGKTHPGQPFPFSLCCTHAVAKALFPGLPRRGLRAVAGYLGFSVPEARRSREHVVATSFIWREVVRRLVRSGVRTFGDLEEWLAGERSARVQARREYPMKREERATLPNRPGVYLMLRSDGSLLYVGKALSLRRRVASYFGRNRHSDLILEMLSQARRLRVTVLESVLEAAILECELIKSLHPPYNQALRAAGRSVIFAGPDLGSFTDHADEQHPLGPFFQQYPLEVLSWLISRLAAGRFGQQAFPRLPYQESEGIEGEAEAALEEFSQKHSLRPGCSSLNPLRLRLLRIGRSVARQRASIQADSGGGEREGEEELLEQEEADPDRVRPRVSVAWLESALVQAAKQFARAAWFVCLRDVLVRWRSSNGGFRMAILVGGRLVYAGRQAEGDPVPRLQLSTICRSAQTGKKVADRSDETSRDWVPDFESCERLRVLTTELKRLTGQGRELEVWPAAHRRPIRGRRLQVWLENL